MLALSVVFGLASAVLGHLGAITVPPLFGYESTTTAGMMALAAGLLFVLAALGGPRHGIISKLIHRARLSADLGSGRLRAEDALAGESSTK
jgi:manganese/zinc/iron transport system permease protein